MSRNEKMPRIAFLFPSSRDEIISRVRTGEGTDTALWGMNHIPGAEYFVASPASVQSLFLLPRLLRFDFIIAQDNLPLGYGVSLCAKVFGLKTRWIYLAMNSSILMRRHAPHRVRLFLLKKFWASYFRIVCLSTEQLHDFARLGVVRERLAFVPFGVDARFFQSTGVPREGELIVSVGRDAGRDYTTLLAAAERTGYEFVVVAGHKNILPGTPIPANVSVQYERSHAELRDLYERVRLVVIASKGAQAQEGSDCSGQIVIMDALAAGKAVIATDRAWITDYFIPGQDLVVVEPNDPDAIAQAVNSLWHDTERRKRLAASGHAKVIGRYTTERFAKALLALMGSHT